MEIEILDKADKKKLLQELKVYGIERLDYLLVRVGQRLRIFSGIIGKNELIRLIGSLPVDNLGLYFASLKEGMRLNLDAADLLEGQISGGVIDVDDESARKWFSGENIEIAESLDNAERDSFLIIKNNSDIIGIGKFTGSKILNFLPKERQIR